MSFGNLQPQGQDHALRDVFSLRRILAWFALASVVVSLQWSSGAYQADLSSHPDEAAHAVSALLVRDYLAAGLPMSPLRFATRFYLHYPRVAIGHWPPVFHSALGGWMWIFGRSQGVQLSFLAVLATGLCIALFELARRECGDLAALACSMMFATTRLVQSSAHSIMADLPVGAFTFAAAAAYGFYLETGERRHRVLFFALALLAIGTHGRGLVILLVPVLAPWLADRPRVTRRRAALSALAVAAVIALPFLFQQSLSLSVATVAANASRYVARAGVSLTWLFPALTLCACFLVPPKRSRWTAMIALALANWIFFSVVNTPWEDRHLLTCAPALALLAARGWTALSQRTSPFRVPPALLGLACLLVVASQLVMLGKKPDLGYSSAVGRLPRIDRVSLVAGDSLTEGAFVAEMAFRDPALERVVLRGSKMLGRSTWSGADYRMLIPDSQALSEFLERMRVGTIVIQPSATAPHIALLQSFLKGNHRWPDVRATVAGAEIYQLSVAPASGPVHIRIEGPGGFKSVLEGYE